MAATSVSGTLAPSSRGASTVTYDMPSLLEPAQHLFAPVDGEPVAVAELDEHLVAAELVARPLEVVERRGLRDDVGRHLEEDPAELPGLAQRLERGQELAEHDRALLGRRAVDPAAGIERHPVAEVGRQLLEAHRVARHQPERLDVHHEAVGRPVGPVLHHRLVGDAVEGRVDLDGREVLRVPGEPFLRAAGRVGYQCLTSASSAHEQVPMRTGAATAASLSSSRSDPYNPARWMGGRSVSSIPASGA